jgi:drug/metabolite transporter (DMT)-like permease
MVSASYNTNHRRGTALAAAGVTILSFDALLVRLAQAEPAAIIVWRGLLMAASLTAALRLARSDWPWQDLRRVGWRAGLLMLTMGLTQILFVSAILHTRAANVVVILTAAPLFAAVFSGVLLREWVPARTWLAMALCIAGIALVFGGSIGGGHWFGDALALLAALVVGANFTQLRHTPDVSRLTVVGGGGLVSALLALAFADPFSLGAETYAVLGLMGLLQLPLALVLMTEATRYLPSAEASLFLVVEAILGTLWVWLVVGEEPPELTLVGGSLVVVTLAGHSWIALQREQAGA